MLIFSLNEIGNKLLKARKRLGYTQEEAAELASISDRTYADIERGTVNMRLLTFLQICDCLKVAPNDILTKEAPTIDKNELINAFDLLSPKQKTDVLKILSVLIDYAK